MWWTKDGNFFTSLPNAESMEVRNGEGKGRVNFHITHKNATLTVISKEWLKLLQNVYNSKGNENFYYNSPKCCLEWGQ